MMASRPPLPGAPKVDYSYEHAKTSLGLLHRAGVPILASTDANSAPIPGMPRYGTALHDEFELLVDAGLSTLEVLRAATVLPAKYIGLEDRGEIREGMRADLVLLGADPLMDIKATRQVNRVWCGGVEFVPKCGLVLSESL